MSLSVLCKRMIQAIPLSICETAKLQKVPTDPFQSSLMLQSIAQGQGNVPAIDKSCSDVDDRVMHEVFPEPCPCSAQPQPG